MLLATGSFAPKLLAGAINSPSEASKSLAPFRYWIVICDST